MYVPGSERWEGRSSNNEKSSVLKLDPGSKNTYFTEIRMHILIF